MARTSNSTTPATVTTPPAQARIRLPAPSRDSRSHNDEVVVGGTHGSTQNGRTWPGIGYGATAACRSSHGGRGPTGCTGCPVPAAGPAPDAPGTGTPAACPAVAATAGPAGTVGEMVGGPAAGADGVPGHCSAVGAGTR